MPTRGISESSPIAKFPVHDQNKPLSQQRKILVWKFFSQITAERCLLSGAL